MRRMMWLRKNKKNKSNKPPEIELKAEPVKVGVKKISADGKIEMGFNQKLDVPDFIKKR